MNIGRVALLHLKGTGIGKMSGEGGRGHVGLTSGISYPDESVLVPRDGTINVEHVESVIDTVYLQWKTVNDSR